MLLVVAAALAVGANVPFAAAQDDPRGPRPVERLLVRFEGGAFTLLGRTPLRKTIPPSDALPEVVGGLSGFWYELQDGAGAVLYRRVIENPVQQVFEGPDPDIPGARAPDRQEAIADARTFALLVPQAPSAAAVVLFSSPLQPGAQARPATEVGRLSLLPVIP